MKKKPDVTRIAEENSTAGLIRRCDREFVLALEEGFGNREWLWFPCIPPAELEAWWSVLEDAETFWRADTRASWPGEFVSVDENPELSQVWESLWNNGTFRARVELNEQFDLAEPDTYLRTSDGKILLHKGAFRLEDGGSSDTEPAEPPKHDEGA